MQIAVRLRFAAGIALLGILTAVALTLPGAASAATFTNDVEVHDAAGKLIASDGFQCEGDIPGEGFGCVGTYTTNSLVSGTFDVSEREACAEPRIDATLVVVAETIDVVTGAPKKTSTGALGGPFDFGRPRGCPKSSVISGLLAELELVRSLIRES